MTTDQMIYKYTPLRKREPVKEERAPAGVLGYRVALHRKLFNVRM